MPLSPGTRLGPYEVVALIGQGGMGQVYRATDTTLKRAVAIKVLPDDVAADRDRLSRFRREAEMLAALNHPNIAQIHAVHEYRESQTGEVRPIPVHALVMELVEGPTLADRIAQGPLPVDETLAAGIAKAREAVDSGAAKATLERWVAASSR